MMRRGREGKGVGNVASQDLVMSSRVLDQHHPQAVFHCIDVLLHLTLFSILSASVVTYMFRSVT